MTVSSDCVKHVKLGHEGSTFPRVLTRRQSSGRDLLGLAKTQTGMTRALTRRQSGGRQDLLGLDQRRNSCGKSGTQRDARNALRLASRSRVEIDKENTSTLNRLNVISIGNGEDQEFSEFETVREEFLRMTGNKNLKVLAIDIVKNQKLEEKFEIQKSVFKAEGLSDLPVLLFAYSDIVDVEQVTCLRVISSSR